MLNSDLGMVDCMLKYAVAVETQLLIDSLSRGLPALKQKAAGYAKRLVSAAKRGTMGEAISDGSAKLVGTTIGKGMDSGNSVIRGTSSHINDIVKNTNAGGNFGAEAVAGTIAKGLEHKSPLVRKGASMAASDIGLELKRLGQGPDHFAMGWGGLSGVSPETALLQSVVEKVAEPAVKAVKSSPKTLKRSAKNLAGSLAIAGHMTGMKPAANYVAHQPIALHRGIGL